MKALQSLNFHLPSVLNNRNDDKAYTRCLYRRRMGGLYILKLLFNNEIIPFLKSLKDIFNVFDRNLLNEIMEVHIVFNQIEAVVQQSSVDKHCLEIVKKELILENDRLLEQIMSQDVLLTVMNSMSLNGESVNMDRKRKESCDKCFNLEAELLKSQNAHNDLLKSYSQLEKHCISLELSIQLNQEIFQKDESCDNQNALEIPEFFENNDLKAQLQDKDSTICKLKDIIKSMKEKSKEENVNYDYCELETKNVELENSVAKLISENERLCNEINHVKQVFKEQFDSIKKTYVCTKEHNDYLIDKMNLKSIENEDLKAQIQDKVFVITSLKNDLRKVKGKDIVDSAAQILSAHTIIPGMFKLDLEPLAPSALDFSCKHAQRIQELLVYVRDTCPNAIKLSAKKVAVTPKNKVKKVRFAEPLTSSSNIKQVESSTTSYSNTPMLSPTGLKCSTSNCGSKPTCNKKNDRISRTPSRNMKNKVEAQPRKVNKKNSVVEPIRDVDVKHSLLNANSEPICATCKKSMFDGVHDMCILDFVENVNSRRTFTIVGNSCPLTRITSANIVPPKKTTSHSVETQKPELKVYSRKPKNVKNIGSSKKAKIVESKNANHSELNYTWGSNATDTPSSFSLVMTVRFKNNHIARILGYGDYQLGNVTISRVYYVEGLGHNLSRDTNLYIISLDDMLKTSPICLLSKASKTKSWLWHRRLSHLNFGTLNKLAKDGLARGIPRLKFQKDHLCSACALGKSKKSSHQPKAKDTNQEKLYLLHMDLCGPMRVASINRKRFLRTKDEAPEAIIKCIKNIQVRLNATVRNVRTDNGTEFVNQTLREFYENVGISHQTSVARTPQQNGVVERRNRTLVEAARTISGPMLHSMTPTTPSSGLVLNPPPLVPFVLPSRKEWDVVFKPMFDEFYSPPASVAYLVPVVEDPTPVEFNRFTFSTTVDQMLNSPSTSQNPHHQSQSQQSLSVLTKSHTT
ncbi:retrovirus-related pol polyprotein from transposon TNT 1-94 [Tanacetum coccineum]